MMGSAENKSREGLPQESQENIAPSKLSLERRLRDRWGCTVHGCCYRDFNFGLHVRLSGEDIDKWVLTIHNGHATLLRPPDFLLPASSGEKWAPDTSSVSSRNTIKPQQPFRMTLRPDLTDLHTWRHILSNRSMDSGKSSTFPGLRCAAEWIGKKILSLIVAIDSNRRLWRAGSLTKCMKKVPGAALESWLVEHEKQVNELLDDLLELSSDGYGPGIQKRSIELGSTFQEDLLKAEYHHKPDFSPEFLIITAKATPFVFFGDCSEDPHDLRLGASLRDVLLQEHIANRNFVDLMPVLISCVCDELLYGPFSTTRAHGFKLLYDLFQLPAGEAELIALARPGGCLRDLAKRISDGAIADPRERFRAIQFFSLYADKRHDFRDYVNASAKHLVPLFQPTDGKATATDPDWDAGSWRCATLGVITQLPWGISPLLDIQICKALTEALVLNHKVGCPTTWLNYNSTWALHNIFDRGGPPAQEMVAKALSHEVVSALQDLTRADVPWKFEDPGVNVRKWVPNLVAGSNRFLCN